MTLVLTGATLIDGTGAAPVPDAAVVIDGERIIAAGPRRGLAWPADAQVMDVAGPNPAARAHRRPRPPGLARLWPRHALRARRAGQHRAHAHRAGARRDARHGLHDGPRRGRARLGLQAGRRAGADPGAAPRAGDPDHLADGRHRRSREPVRSRLLLRRLRSPASEFRRQWPGRRPRRGAHHGPRRRRRHQDGHHRRRQLAPRPRAQGRGVLARGDAGARHRVPRTRPPRDVPRARRARAAHRAGRGRRLDRARLLPRRGAGDDGADGRARRVPRAHAHRLRVSPREPGAPRARPRARAATSTTSRPCSAPSSWACPSPRAPTRAATAIRRTRSRSSTWWRRASRRCRRCAPPPSGRPSASASSASWARWRRAASRISSSWTATPSTTSRSCSSPSGSSWWSRAARSAWTGARVAPSCRFAFPARSDHGRLTMKAALFYAPSSPMRIEAIDIATPSATRCSSGRP